MQGFNMGIMDYIPQFGDNTQDVSGLPQDDSMMQLALKRKLALADALRQQEAPQGQMVSGHYVAPHWTQQLAALGNQIVGRKQEENAMKQYGEYQTAKSAKLGALLDQLNKGKQVESPVDYQDAGGMPGVTQTTQQPFNQQEYMAKIGAVMPEMLPKMLETNFAQRFKENTPIKGSAGDVFFDPITHKPIMSVPAKEDKTTFSTLGKLTSELQQIQSANPNDPRIPQYQDAIKKETNLNTQAPVERKRMKGLTEVQEVMIAPPSVQYPEGQWKQVGQGPRFAPEKPQSDVAKENLIFNKTRGLREDFAQLPETKSWNVIQPILVSVREAAKDTSGASDLNLIYGRGKIMDPNSVVREGELQMAGNTGNLGQRLQGYYKSIANGGKLPPAVKQDLLNQIESRAKPQQMLYENTKKKYTEIAKRNNLNPEDLFVEGITTPATSSARSAADAILGH